MIAPNVSGLRTVTVAVAVLHLAGCWCDDSVDEVELEAPGRERDEAVTISLGDSLLIWAYANFYGKGTVLGGDMCKQYFSPSEPDRFAFQSSNAAVAEVVRGVVSDNPVVESLVIAVSAGETVLSVTSGGVRSNELRIKVSP
jgi:hypothetical protein